MAGGGGSALLRLMRRADGFGKVEGSYRAQSSSGGLATLIVSIVLFFLVFCEVRDHLQVTTSHEFLVDHRIAEQMQINLDVTVKMPCELISVDVADQSGTLQHVPGAITTFPAYFETRDAKVYRKTRQPQPAPGTEVDGKPTKDGEPDACRVHGSVLVNKIAGNLHITALGHGHGGAHTDHAKMNFTHRIDKLSFGLPYPNLVNPLDNSLEVATQPFEEFKYFISIVPTTYKDLAGNLLVTNQYAVTDSHKAFDEPSPMAIFLGLVPTPYIMFKYDIEPIVVDISESKQPFVHFIVRLCGAIGGIYICMGLLHQLIDFVGRHQDASKRAKHQQSLKAHGRTGYY
ncbi:DUF1692-domain-containing protein [Ramicandelaber brevisporus]|nr:DUF1692-domain-containing protein [Ramicandelaber brevisporus]